jgi:hypothetical protein
MSEFVVYDPYQPGPIAPVVQMKKNISVWTGAQWEHFLVEFIEGQPLGSQNVIDMVNVAGATTIAANGTLAKRVITQLRVNIGEMLHLRWRPLESLEGILWEQPNKSRFESRALLSRVDWRTGEHDPYYAATTFFIVGVGQGDRDMNLEVRNPTGWAYPQANFEFWGYRYTMTSITIPPADKAAMARGDLDAIKRIMGATTFVVAEGRSI